MNDYRRKVKQLLAHAERYHERYYLNKTFYGPSYFFHTRALKELKSGNFTRALEYLYAVLPSWGMHRMGKGGPKMEEFEVFKKSVLRIKPEIYKLRKVDFNKVSEVDWQLIELVFKGIKVMDVGTFLIGNSKVMAHLLSNLIPPIDREYTLTYLDGRGYINNGKNGIEWQWQKMRSIIEGFYMPVARDERFRQLASGWLANRKQYRWDTSIIKIIDNLIVGA